jgi:hypothetical protein
MSRSGPNQSTLLSASTLQLCGQSLGKNQRASFSSSPPSTTLYSYPSVQSCVLHASDHWNALIRCYQAAAIAAGNCVLLKPSEQSAATSALMAELAPKYLDPDIFRVINGAIPETTRVSPTCPIFELPFTANSCWNFDGITVSVVGILPPCHLTLSCDLKSCTLVSRLCFIVLQVL